jgi:hypothetical protein
MVALGGGLGCDGNVDGIKLICSGHIFDGNNSKQDLNLKDRKVIQAWI